MSVKELRALTLDKLVAELTTKRGEARDSRKALAAGELANPRVIRNQRREIATLNTLIAEKRRETKLKEKDNA
jgi:ribosomal protein L29